MAAPTVAHDSLPEVREAQGLLLRAIFGHPAFDLEGERMYGKLFYFFEETIAINDALELAHLGDDADGAVRNALGRAIELDTLVSESDPEGKLLQEAREKYRAKVPAGEEIQDIDLGDGIRFHASAVVKASQKVLGQ